MKTTKELKIWSLRMVLFTILLSGLSVQNNSVFTTDYYSIFYR